MTRTIVVTKCKYVFIIMIQAYIMHAAYHHATMSQRWKMIQTSQYRSHHSLITKSPTLVTSTCSSFIESSRINDKKKTRKTLGFVETTIK